MYVTVEVEQGTLRGQQKTSDYFSHKRYFSFQGIPFAKPPLGPLRFKDPEEPEAWSGIRDALKEGCDCFQYHHMFKKMIGSEDCLYLNVYTPQLNGDAGLPVMVWVHGGGFVTGSGSTELYGPDYLIEQDVIIVTINYRLSVLVPATSQSFLPVVPRQLLEQGKFAKVPTIIGTTSAEGMLSFLFLDLSEDNFPKVYKNIEKFIIQDLGLSASNDKAKQISKQLKQFYFGDSPVTVDKLDSFFELYGDLMFDYGIDECVRLTVENKESAPIYAYEFTHSLSNSCMKVFQQVTKPSSNFKGVNHAEDLSVLFAHNTEGMPKPSTEDQEFIAEVTKMWANFAKTGNPNCYGMEATWAPVKKNNFCHLEIGKELKLVPGRVKEERMTLWQQLYDKRRSSQ